MHPPKMTWRLNVLEKATALELTPNLLLSSTFLESQLVSGSSFLSCLDSSSFLSSSFLRSVLHDNRLPLEFIGEDSLITSLCQRSMSSPPGSMCTLVNETALRLVKLVLFFGEVSEAPLLCNTDLLATGDLVTCTTAGLDSLILMILTGTNRHKDLLNAHASDKTDWLTESVTHTGLEPIRPGTRKHLVDTEDMEGMRADAHVETILTALRRHVLVDDDTCSLETLGGDLLLLVGHQVDAEWECVNIRLSFTNIVNADFRVRDTTTETRLDVRLVLSVSVATSW